MHSKSSLAVLAFVLLALGAWLWSTRSLPLTPTLTSNAETAANDAQLNRPSREAIERTALDARAREGEAIGAKTLLRARFVDGQGNPLAGVEVDSEMDDGQVRATSGVNGQVELEFQLRRETRRVYLRAKLAGWADAIPQAEILQLCTVDLGDIVLTRGAVIAGRVIDDRGAGVTGAGVGVYADDGDPGPSPTTSSDPNGSTLVHVLSAADGSFRLEGVPLGKMRVWAQLWQKTLWGWSPALDIAAGAHIGELELTLLPIPSDFVLEVQVYAPDGSPVKRAEVRYDQACPDGGRSSATRSTDESGHLSETLRRACALRLIARDQGGRFGAVSLRDARPGTLIVVHLTEPHSIELSVTDEDDRPIERFAARVLDADPPSPIGNLSRPDDRARLVGSSLELGPHPKGTCMLQAPDMPFVVKVGSDEYQAIELGPFEGSNVPEKLHARLTSLARVAGVVRENGQPIPGAEVLLLRAIAPDTSAYFDGIPMHSERSGVARAVSDADGRFGLRVRDAGSYFVRAAIAGLPAAEVGPLAIDPNLRASEIEIELSPGGAIEGSVIANDGSKAAGVIVCAMNGDAFPVSTVTDASGAYRFDGLRPGPWRLAQRDRPVPASDMPFSTRGGAPPEFRFSCRVLAGETAHFDLDARANVEVRGHITGLGASFEGWSAGLNGFGIEGGATPRTAIDANGDFRVRATEAGVYELSIRARLTPLLHLNMQDRVTLVAGTNAWQPSLAAGGLSITAPPGSKRHVQLECEPRDGLRLEMSATTGENGALEVPWLPAGSWLVFERLPLPVRELARVEVRAGGTSTLALP